MNVSALEVAAAIVVGTAASVAGGYLGGVAIGAKNLGPKLSGFLGVLYGPAGGGLGVVIGVVAVSVLATKA